MSWFNYWLVLNLCENDIFFNSKLDCKTVRIFAYSSTREQSNKRSGMQSNSK